MTTGHELPTTTQVLLKVRANGVIVGSWPTKGDEAKDLDLVVKAAPAGERVKLFREILKAWPEACSSSILGHLFVQAVPMNVELFESRGTLPPDDPEKRPGVLSFHQARRRARWVQAYGVTMRAVR